jgi:hypothetical protein
MEELARASVLDRLQITDPGSILGDQTSERDIEMRDESSTSWIIAVDFGTTFSTVAYAKVTESTRETGLSLLSVECIDGYPDDRPLPGSSTLDALKPDVPSELWYGPKSQPPDDEPDDEDVMDTDSGSNTPRSSSEIGDDGNNFQEQESRTLDALYWGFGVQKLVTEIDVQKDGTKRISRFKLMLDENNERTRNVTDELRPILKNLKKLKLIKDNADVISDYLTQLFIHTKNKLQQNDDFSTMNQVEIVLCVPAVWPAKACRTMEKAMSIAAKNSGLGKLENGNLCNLFLVSEPEAAAACVIAEHGHGVLVSVSW